MVHAWIKVLYSYEIFSSDPGLQPLDRVFDGEASIGDLNESWVVLNRYRDNFEDGFWQYRYEWIRATGTVVAIVTEAEFRPAGVMDGPNYITGGELDFRVHYDDYGPGYDLDYPGSAGYTWWSVDLNGDPGNIWSVADPDRPADWVDQCPNKQEAQARIGELSALKNEAAEAFNDTSTQLADAQQQLALALEAENLAQGIAATVAVKTALELGLAVLSRGWGWPARMVVVADAIVKEIMDEHQAPIKSTLAGYFELLSATIGRSAHSANIVYSAYIAAINLLEGVKETAQWVTTARQLSEKADALQDQIAELNLQKDTFGSALDDLSDEIDNLSCGDFVDANRPSASRADDVRAADSQSNALAGFEVLQLSPEYALVMAASDGDNVIDLEDGLGLAIFVLLAGGGGNDTVTFGTETSIQMDGLAGSDVANFNGNLAAIDHTLSFGPNVFVYLWNGTIVELSNFEVIKADNGVFDPTIGRFGAWLVTTADADGVFRGSGGIDFLNGTGNADVLAGGAGDDTYVVNNAGDRVIEGNDQGTDLINSSISFSLNGLYVENLTLTGTTAINATGDGLANVLTGNAGINVLNGLGGADTMAGGLGNDTYYVDNAGDVVDESIAGSNGIDTVQSSISLSLNDTVHAKGAIENLTLLGSSNLNGLGNSLNNVLVGNSGANSLNGLLGADLMQGSAGNDTYVVDNAGDIVDESVAGSSGIDVIRSTVSFSLADAVHAKGDIENVTLLGAANLNALGNALANVLVGNTGANTLNGGLGADTMQGGAGNDNYAVDNAGDVVDESVAGSNGVDTVRSSISFSLADAVHAKGAIENVTLVGTGNLNALGNALANILIGTTGANTLNGGLGADTMQGGAGNDLYTVENAGDIVDESVAGSNGVDLVRSTISFSLADPVHARGAIENITLLGTANLNALGNALNNVLIGNVGANTLNGGLGADIMRGGAGNDNYAVDSLADLVDESLAGSNGVDLVRSTVSFNLTSTAQALGTIENVTLLGAANINVTGNSSANVLIGNNGANLIIGGLGNDTLTGGAGNDVFLFNAALGAANVDRITDMNELGNDTIRLENAVFTALTTTGGLATGAFRIGAAALDADDRVIYNSANGQLSYDINGSGAGGSVVFAILDPGLALTAADFVVV